MAFQEFRQDNKKWWNVHLVLIHHTFVRKERKARVLVLLFLGKVRVSWQPGHGISGISLRQQKVVKCSPRSDSYEREARVPSLLELFTKTKRWWNVDPQIQYERKAPGLLNTKERPGSHLFWIERKARVFYIRKKGPGLLHTKERSGYHLLWRRRNADPEIQCKRKVRVSPKYKRKPNYPCN